jgi:hypothetical protein
MTKPENLIAALPFALLLVACGGGGGGGSDGGGGNGAGVGAASGGNESIVANATGQAGVSGPGSGQTVSTPAFPIASAMVTLATVPYSYLKYYRDPANDLYTLAGEFRPGGVLPFEGVSAHAGFAASSRSKNGTLVWMRSQIDYYQSGTYLYLGSAFDNREYVVASNQAQPPATATVGEKGHLYAFTGYRDNSKAEIINTGTVTWELLPDTGSTANLCVNQHISYRDGRPDTLSSACNKINATGLHAASRIVITSDGKTETFLD